MSKPLTDRQQDVLNVIESHVQKHGFPPTLREIGEVLGLNNLNAVRGHLAALEKKGYVTRAPDKARSIQLTPTPSVFSRVKRKLHEVFHTDEGVVHRIVYGLAWATWQGRPFFTGPARDWLNAAIVQEALEHGWTILERRIEPDHVVVVLSAWPNHSAEQTVRRLQNVGKLLKRQHPDAFAGETLWDKGYFATTDLELLEELVARHLGRQREPNAEEKPGPDTAGINRADDLQRDS